MRHHGRRGEGRRGGACFGSRVGRACLPACLPARSRPPPTRRTMEQARISSAFKDDVVPGLCVRTLYDCLLRSLRLPRESVVCFTPGINIADMVAITEAHGLKVLALDVDVDTLLPRGDGELADLLARVPKHQVRVLLHAHLFGACSPVDRLVEQCRTSGILFVEDLAEAWAGPDVSRGGYLGNDRADVCLFSFGTIKTATALGGAVARVRDPVLRETMRANLNRLAVRPASVDAVRYAYYLPLNQATHPRPFGAVVKAMHALGMDYDEFIRRQSRGFSRDKDLFVQMRLRPSVALLKVLARRLEGFDYDLAKARRDAGRALREEIESELAAGVGQDLYVPGGAAASHNYWLFPVAVSNPAVDLGAVAKHMLSHGFDVTSGTTQLASVDALVLDPADSLFQTPERAKAMMNRVVYLPLELDAERRTKMVLALGVALGILDEDQLAEHDDDSGSSLSDSQDDEDSDSDSETDSGKAAVVVVAAKL
jgi:perosamine synthetase